MLRLGRAASIRTGPTVFVARGPWRMLQPMAGARFLGLTPKLREVVHLDLLAQEPPETICDVWKQRHEAVPSMVGAWMSGETFKELQKRASMHPMFLFKVPRGGNFTVLVSNFSPVTDKQSCTAVFSLADEFRATAHAASPVLAVNFWDELNTAKNLVLIRATIMPGVQLSKEEATRLLGLLIQFYAGDSAAGKAGFAVVEPADYELVRTFNERPMMFDMDAFLGSRFAGAS